uniref:hypothetical protein n=1 Tax=Pseudoruegeria sp. HB172150 TaxID=2721164 RepID=UPI00352EFB39
MTELANNPVIMTAEDEFLALFMGEEESYEAFSASSAKSYNSKYESFLYYTYRAMEKIGSFSGTSSVGKTDAKFVRAGTVNAHAVSDYFAGLKGRIDKIIEAEDAAEFTSSILKATGSTSSLMKYVTQAGFAQAISNLRSWHEVTGSDLGLVYPTDSKGASLQAKIMTMEATPAKAMAYHHTVILHNIDLEVARILTDAGLDLTAASSQFDDIFRSLENEIANAPAELQADLAARFETLKKAVTAANEDLVNANIRLTIAEKIGDSAEIEAARTKLQTAQTAFSELNTTIDDFQRTNNINAPDVTSSKVAGAMSDVETYKSQAIGAIDADSARIDNLAKNYLLTDDVNPIYASDGKLDYKFGLAADALAVGSMIVAMTTDDFKNASEIEKAQVSLEFIGVTLNAVANGLNLADLEKLQLGTVSAGTAFIVTSALIKLDGLRQALDDPNLTNTQRTALEAEFALQTTAVTLSVAQGAIDLAIHAGVAGSKYLLKASPIISCIAAVATTINPSKWAEFASKEDYIDVVEARGDYSSEVLGDALSNSLKIEQDYYIAKTVVDAVFTLASGIMMASGVGAPIAFVTGAIGGIASLVMSAIEEARLEKLAEKTLDDITDGGTRSIDDFFQESLEKSFEDTQERYTPIFDKLLDSGEYGSAVLIGNETLTQTDLELILMARIDGQVTNYAGNFGSSYTLDDGWQDEKVHIEEDEFAQNKVILEDDDGDKRYVTFSTPLLEKHQGGYTVVSGFYDYDDNEETPTTHILNILSFNGWSVEDDSQDTGTTFDIKWINNELIYEDRYIDTKQIKSAEPFGDRVRYFYESVEYVHYTGNSTTKTVDFSIEARGGDDTYIAHGNFVNFDGGEGRDAVIYSLLDEEDVVGGIVIENYADQIAGDATNQLAGVMRVTTTMAAGTEYTREAIVRNTYDEGSTEKEESHTEQATRASDQEIYDDLISVEEIVATSLDDRIDLRGHSGNGNSVIEVHGLAGDDEIFGDTTTNIITGGAGDDVLDISWRLSETTATFQSLISQLGVTDLYISNVVGDGLLTRAQADALQQTVFDATGMWASETLHEQLAAYANGER